MNAVYLPATLDFCVLRQMLQEYKNEDKQAVAKSPNSTKLII